MILYVVQQLGKLTYVYSDLLGVMYVSDGFLLSTCY